MRRFTELDAVAAPLLIDNVDTDKILPGEYLKTVSRTELGQALFARMRYHDDGREIADFILNRDPWRHAGILVVGDNFGCGSSREHAPWALLDFGITCIIARSFADIFYNNCFKNGILPIRLDASLHGRLANAAGDPETARLRIDLTRQQIIGPDGSISEFDVEAGAKVALLEGRDEISETLLQRGKIDAWQHDNLDLTPPVVLSHR
ncbi:3-isopropylmalate dehydratase small subunit [Sphingopyxis sp.]|uniref:3-isopropylmalate dehydratase small subunit n=1 Tax=Sphingopyxis sp. TaxID=1908224 RepID=UPI0025EDD527|nr:3-isopropylmalate dehydratase small subunit [Sphingopyxis sp.]MBR2174964.1 3-isopropylmalate dehydratase small subunit [Sphingopyxis sp.]